MPIIAPRKPFARLEQVDPKALRDNAKSVVARLDDYVPAEPPERPEQLELDDRALIEAAQKRERGRKLTKPEKEALQLFGTWRAAVWRIEAANCGNLIMLLGVLNTLEAHERTVEAQQVRTFLLERYDAPIPVTPAPRAATDWAERWADRYSQRRDVMPLALRRLEGSVTMTKPTAEPEEREQGSYEGF